MRFYQGYIQDNNLGKYQVVALVLTTIFLNTTMAVLYASIGHEKLDIRLLQLPISSCQE